MNRCRFPPNKCLRCQEVAPAGLSEITFHPAAPLFIWIMWSVGLILISLWGGLPGDAAQAPSASRAIGVVTAVDAAARRVRLKPDSGPEITVELADGAPVLRIAPDERDLRKAERLALRDVVPGDRVLARGVLSDDGKLLRANQLVVMRGADIERKQQADRDDWRQRGLSGIVMAVDPGARAITVRLPGPAGGRTLLVETRENTRFLRYAPASVRFSDARPSRFEEIQVGDQLRSLGDRSADGSRQEGEQVLAGSFRTAAGTIQTIDAARKSVTLLDLESRKPLVVQVNSDSNLRRLAPSVAEMLGRRLQGADSPEAGRATQAAGQRQPDLEQLLERMPRFEVAELKPGDVVIVSSAGTAEPGKVTALTLVAGVEPVLAAAPQDRREVVLGNWNLEIMGPPQ